MKIVSIRLKNFKAFKNAEMLDIPPMCVIVGANGTGKSSLFSIFGFLKDALTDNVRVALTKLGGSRGFQEVRSRNSEGPIEIEIKFRDKLTGPLTTYFLSINEDDNGQPFVERETLKVGRRTFLKFEKGKGFAIYDKPERLKGLSEFEQQYLTIPPNNLAIRGLFRFEEYPAIMAMGDLIENWHISDFHINRARPEQEAGYAEHLSKEGRNLSLVTEFLYEHHPEIFKKILQKLSERVPGINKVNSKTTEEGRVLLKFQDGSFEDPFLARYVSDGTIKMLAYLILLYDPTPHPLLCVEEPENQLYPKLLLELAEEFRDYARRGGQVFISTHSPDFLNAVNIDEVFWLVKEDGYTKIKRAKEDEQISAYMAEGDKMGYLWKQGFFEGADPA